MSTTRVTRYVLPALIGVLAFLGDSARAQVTLDCNGASATFATIQAAVDDYAANCNALGGTISRDA